MPRSLRRLRDSGHTLRGQLLPPQRASLRPCQLESRQSTTGLALRVTPQTGCVLRQWDRVRVAQEQPHRALTPQACQEAPAQTQLLRLLRARPRWFLSQRTWLTRPLEHPVCHSQFLAPQLLLLQILGTSNPCRPDIRQFVELSFLRRSRPVQTRLLCSTEQRLAQTKLLTVASPCRASRDL